MAKSRDELPALYAMAIPGLETILAEEITRDLSGDVRKTDRGLVVFRADIDESLLQLRTAEDVFLLAWGTDELTHRAIDLKSIRHWTEKSVDWPRLFSYHHAIRPKPKGKPSYRIVTQMHGKYAYRRIDAQEALEKGLAGVFPTSWRPAEENASLEIWLTIQGETAFCGVRLSDRTMRHRTYKREHLPASLRPSLAAAMARLSGPAAGEVVLDPMCGAGTILAETVELAKARRAGEVQIVGGDLDATAIQAASLNLRRFGPSLLARWDARRLPLAEQCVDRIACNPPFGVQLGDPEEIPNLYAQLAREFDRVLRPGGRAVLLVADAPALLNAVRPLGWESTRQVRLVVLGQRATLGVWRKPVG